jgi:NDP-sugar pyrophosphorylase family protein
MKVVLLAGGNSTRMAPYSAWTEKSLLPINGKPIIRIIIDRIQASILPNIITGPEIEYIVCILGKYRPNFEWEFRDTRSIPIEFSEKVEAIGTATHYYYAAEKEFHFSPEETVLIHYADALTELDYAHFLKVFEESKTEAMIAVTKNAKHDYSEIVLEDTSPIDDMLTLRRVEEFHEKPRLTAPTWTGIMLLKHKIMQEEFGNPLFGKRCDFAYDIFPKLVEKKKLYAYSYDGMWLDCGNLHSYSKAVEQFRGGSLFV